MLRPKGFGKNYFTLSAIQAYSVHITIESIATTMESRHLIFAEEDDASDLLDDDELLLLNEATTQQSGSHCSCFDTRRSLCRIKNHPVQQHSLSIFQSLRPSNSPPLIN